jgi:hypothetical protein
MAMPRNSGALVSATHAAQDELCSTLRSGNPPTLASLPRGFARSQERFHSGGEQQNGKEDHYANRAAGGRDEGVERHMNRPHTNTNAELRETLCPLGYQAYSYARLPASRRQPLGLSSLSPNSSATARMLPPAMVVTMPLTASTRRILPASGNASHASGTQATIYGRLRRPGLFLHSIIQGSPVF